MTFTVGLVVGIFVGAILGLFIMALCVAADRADRMAGMK